LYLLMPILVRGMNIGASPMLLDTMKAFSWCYYTVEALCYSLHLVKFKTDCDCDPYWEVQGST